MSGISSMKVAVLMDDVNTHASINHHKKCERAPSSSRRRIVIAVTLALPQKPI